MKQSQQMYEENNELQDIKEKSIKTIQKLNKANTKMDLYL